MPTKRTRRTRHARPAGLAGVRQLELQRWVLGGPLIAGGVTDNEGNIVPAGETDSGYIIRESWDAWAEFYGQVREEWLAGREARLAARREAWRTRRSLAQFADEVKPEPAAERLYRCWETGGDVAAERRAIAAEQRAAEDPRLLLGRS